MTLVAERPATTTTAFVPAQRTAPALTCPAWCQHPPAHGHQFPEGAVRGVHLGPVWTAGGLDEVRLVQHETVHPDGEVERSDVRARIVDLTEPFIVGEPDIPGA